jgi:hypothetical protein
MTIKGHQELITALLLILAASPAWAGSSRTFVSGSGSDSNPCSVSAPCRSFTAALTKTNPGGEIVVLTSAGYGPFTISKGVTITAPAGVYAGISAASGDAITINAAAGASISLSGLTLNGLSSGSNGISVGTSNSQVTVSHCVIENFTLEGINDIGTGTSLTVQDSTASFNGDNGVLVAPPSGMTNATLKNVTLNANGGGLAVFDGGVVDVTDSVADGNGNGFAAQASTTSVQLTIVGSVASNNLLNGIAAAGGPTSVSVGGSTASHNSTGFAQISGASFFSQGNNTVQANTTSKIFGTITLFSGT